MENIINRMIITTHGKRRLRKRLGLKYTSQLRLVIKAFTDGVIISKGKNNSMLIKYNGNIYVFGWDFNNYAPLVITAYNENEEMYKRELRVGNKQVWTNKRLH